MSELRQILKKMKSTNSMGIDDISVRTLKQAQCELEPLLLYLINRVIYTTKFPEALKILKVVRSKKATKIRLPLTVGVQSML